MDDNFVCERKPEDWKWIALRDNFKAAIDILEKTDFNPSLIQQNTILSRLSKEICQAYGQELKNFESN